MLDIPESVTPALRRRWLFVWNGVEYLLER